MDNSEWARAEVGGESCWAAQQRAVEAFVRAHASRTVLLAAAAPPAVVLACSPGNAPACAAAVRALPVAPGASLVRALQATCLALQAVCITPVRHPPSVAGPTGTNTFTSSIASRIAGSSTLNNSNSSVATATTRGVSTCNGFRVRVVVLACGAHRELADADARTALGGVLRHVAALRARVDVAVVTPGCDCAALTGAAALGALAAASRDGHCMTADIAALESGSSGDTGSCNVGDGSNLRNGNSNSNNGEEDKREDLNKAREGGLAGWLEWALAGPPPPPRVMVAHEFRLWRPLPRRVLAAEAEAHARRRAATALGHRRAALCAATFGPQQQAPVLAQPTSSAYGLATRILAGSPESNSLFSASFASSAGTENIQNAFGSGTDGTESANANATPVTAETTTKATTTSSPTETPIPRHACTVLGAVPAGEVHVTLGRHATPLAARGTLLFVHTRAHTFEFLWRACVTGEIDDTLAVRRRGGTVRAARVPGGTVLAVTAAAPTPRRALFWAQTRDTARVDAFAAAAQRALGPPAVPLPPNAPFLVPRCVEEAPLPPPPLPDYLPAYVHEFVAVMTDTDTPQDETTTTTTQIPAATTVSSPPFHQPLPLPRPRLEALSHQRDSPFIQPRAQPLRHDSATAAPPQLTALLPSLGSTTISSKRERHNSSSNSSGSSSNRRAQRKEYVARFPHKFGARTDPPEGPGSAGNSPPSHHTSPATAAASAPSISSVPVLFLSSSSSSFTSSSAATTATMSATKDKDSSTAPQPQPQPGNSPLLSLPAGVSPRGMAPLQTPPISPNLVPLPSPPVPLVVSPLVSPGATPLVTPSSSPRPYDTLYAPCLALAGTAAPIPATAFAEHLPSISSVVTSVCPRAPSTDDDTPPCSTTNQERDHEAHTSASTMTMTTTTTTTTDNGSNSSNHTHARRRLQPPPPEQPVCKHRRPGIDHTGDSDGNSSDSGADEGPPPHTTTTTTTTAEPP